MALDISKFIGRFVDEAREHITGLETGLATLGTADDGGRDGIDALFRSAHTIKGSSRMLKLASIAETANHLEDVLGALREGNIQPDPALAALLMRGMDAIGAMIEEVAASGAGAASGPPDQALCERLTRAAAGDWSEPSLPLVPEQSAAADAHSIPDAIPGKIPAATPTPPPSTPDPTPQTHQPTDTEAATNIRAPESVRVRMDKLDALVKLMGEMVSNQARLCHVLGEARLLDATARALAARTVAETGSESAELARALHRFTLDLRDLTLDQERLIGELNDRALGMRMLPLGTALHPIARVARELGRSLGREIRCEVSGSEIELDRQIIDHLSDALVHLVRNAIDHGIESTEERLAAGKPALGEIRLSARQEGGAVLIAICDDGRGLDRARILEKAIQKGLIESGANQETIEEITDDQVADLIFQPGFSTSAIITEVSGRGVGMDVVKRAITDGLQGSVSIKSRPGAGTTLTLKLPLSLAVMRILLLESAGHCFGLTAPHVSELIRATRSETIQVAGRPAVVLRNELVRVFDWIRDRGVTSLITTGEHAEFSARYGLEDYIADCVIALKQEVNHRVMTRVLRVVKRRGRGHGTNEYPFLLDTDGLFLVPVTGSVLGAPVSDQRLSTGIPGLDAMLGGQGLYQGSTILLSGQAGTGKTSIACSLTQAACASGIPVLYLSFEESVAELTRNQRSLGIDIGRYLTDEGRGPLVMQPIRAVELGLEEHLMRVMHLVKRHRPALGVLDPVSSLAGRGDGPGAKEILLRLVKEEGITTVATELLGDDSQGVSHLDVSSMIDVWIKLRRHEHDGEMSRLIFVAKARGLPISDQVKEFRITSMGLRIEDPYIGEGGIVYGTARLARQTEDEETIGQLHLELERARRLRTDLDEIQAASERLMRAEQEANAADLDRQVARIEQRLAASERTRAAIGRGRA